MRALWAKPLEADGFFFITSLYHAVHQCSTPGPSSLTATQWGEIQADYFVDFLDDACTAPGCDVQSMISHTFADLEIVPDVEYDQQCQCNVVLNPDLAGWVQDTGENVIVVSSFEDTLSNYCAANNVPEDICRYPGTFNPGVYSNESEWEQIPGFKDINDPDISTDSIWFAGYVYGSTPESAVNADEDFFTQQGYQVYSWQYTTDDCSISFAGARTMAANASPPIPRLDAWTKDGSHVNDTC